MNYLISKFNCVCSNNMEIKKNVKYKFNLQKNNYLFYGLNNEIPICVNFTNTNNQVLTVCYGGNKYYVLFPVKVGDTFFTKVKHLNEEYYIALSAHLNICTNKETILNCYVEDLTFSHTEQIGNFLLLHFLGKQNFVVIIQNAKVVISSFYDEYNETETEKVFMLKVRDSLNHGRVFKIKNNKFEEYLVYLDDFDLNLNARFVGFVFLDCLLAKNFNYCNGMLASSVKQKEAKNIINFFPEFDYYFETEKNEFILINKNALAGIYKFEINNLIIENIIPLYPTHC